MPEDNPAPPRSQRFRGVDVTFLAQSKYFPAHQPAGGEPASRSDEENQRQHGDSLPYRQHQEKDEEARNGERSIHQSHEDGIHRTAPIARDYADGGSEGHRQNHRQKGDSQRNPATYHHPGKHIAAELVGAERMSQAGRTTGAEHVRLGQRIGEQEGTGQRRECHTEEHQPSDSATWVAPGAPKHLEGRGHPRRTRGSSRAYATSVRKPPATTSAATSNDAPMSSG